MILTQDSITIPFYILNGIVGLFLAVFVIAVAYLTINSFGDEDYDGPSLGVAIPFCLLVGIISVANFICFFADLI